MADLRNDDIYYGSLRFKGRSVLKHYGILGQKWGIRRFQNLDGTLTPEGRERYSKSLRKEIGKAANQGLLGRQNPYAKKTGIDVLSKENRNVVTNAKRGKLKEAFEEYKKNSEEYHRLRNKEFYSDNGKWKKYATISAKNAWKEDSDRLKASGWTLKDFINFFVYDDGDQGNKTAIDYYFESGDSGAKRIKDSEKIMRDSWNNYLSVSRDVAADLLGEYSDEVIGTKSTRYSNGITAKEYLSDMLRED